MTSCQLTVQTATEQWQGEVDPWTALVVLAALSAEPESLDELAQAVQRYQPDHRLFEGPRPADRAAEATGPWCLLDLAGRTAVSGGGFELSPPRDAFQTDGDDHAVGFPVVWLDTPADWLFQLAGDDWRAVVAARAAARAPGCRASIPAWCCSASRCSKGWPMACWPRVPTVRSTKNTLPSERAPSMPAGC